MVSRPIPDSCRETRCRDRARHRPALTSMLLLASCFAPGPASALDPNRALSQYPIDWWGTDNGLPQRSVHSILQTRDGYLWVGTQEGLVRLDGATADLYNHDNVDAFDTNHVEALCEDLNGDLWIGTVGYGIMRKQGRRFERFVPGGDGDQIRDVVTLAASPTGVLWIGCMGQGLWKRSPDGKLERVLGDKLPSGRINSLSVAPSGILWIGTDSGLSTLGPAGLHNFGTPDSNPSTHVTVVVDDGSGGAWVGSNRGLFRFRDGQFAPASGCEHFREDIVQALLLDSNNDLWVGTNGGLHRLRALTCDHLAKEDGLPSENVVSLLEDREGSLWIGSDGGGLGHLRDGKLLNHGARQGIVPDDIYAVCTDTDGSFILGTDEGGLFRYSAGRVDTIIEPNTFEKTPIRTLHVDKQRRIWMATRLGFYRYENGRTRRLSEVEGMPKVPVRSIIEDRAGRIWLGTDGEGIYVLDRESVRRLTHEDGLAGDNVRDLYEGADGSIWIAAYGGLSRWHDGAFTNYGTEQGLSSNLTRSIYEDGDGTVWVGTYGGGLNRLREGRIFSFLPRDGLFNGVAYEILEDDQGRLWMSCNLGIYCVSKDNLNAFAEGRVERIQCTSFGRADGMGSSECNGGRPAARKSPDGRLWFACLRGLVEVDPRRAGLNRVRPPVLVDRVVLQGEDVDPASIAVLAPGVRGLEIHYTALSYIAPEKVRFSYKLEGFDEDWVDAGNRRVAYYTKLPAGNYRFRVIACNNDGVWNREGATLSFRQEPYFYQTWWFITPSATLLLAAGLLLYVARVRRLEHSEAELRARVEDAMGKVRILSGLLPICAACKKIRDDNGYWNQIEAYIRDHSHAEFSHSICPDCAQRLYPEVVAAMETKKPAASHEDS